MHRTAEQPGGKLMRVAPESIDTAQLECHDIPFDVTFHLIFAMRCRGDY